MDTRLGTAGKGRMMTSHQKRCDDNRQLQKQQFEKEMAAVSETELDAIQTLVAQFENEMS